MSACRSDRCRQGRTPCPTPDVCGAPAPRGVPLWTLLRLLWLRWQARDAEARAAALEAHMRRDPVDHALLRARAAELRCEIAALTHQGGAS